jgi:hypothetical protein
MPMKATKAQLANLKRKRNPFCAGRLTEDELDGLAKAVLAPELEEDKNKLIFLNGYTFK